MMPDQNGIYITKKQASIASALLVFLSIIIFIAGYFWGKQSSLDNFTQKTSQDSFNDQVDLMLTMQSFSAKHGNALEQEDKEENISKLFANMPDALEESEKNDAIVKNEPASTAALNNSDKKVDTTPVKKEAVNTASTKTSEVSRSILSTSANSSNSNTHWVALAGFGKKSSALMMGQKLQKYKIDYELKTKVSKSASGKGTKTWYQIVTKKYPSRDELDQVIDRIVSVERINRKDIKYFNS